MRFFLPLLLFSSIAFAEPVRYVFTAPHFGAREATFGLKASQLEQLRELTRFSRVYTVDADSSLMAEYSKLEGFSGVIRANVPPPGQVTENPIGDPEFGTQWWVEKLRVREAWVMATGAGVTIADCDAGYYTDEPDIAGNLLLDFRKDLSNTDAPDVVNDGPFAYHGTAVVAIMAGVLDAQGTNGIAPGAKVVPLQNYNYDSSDKLDKEEATAACVLQALATPDVDIIVLENQTYDGSSETFVGTREAVRMAMQAGIIVVGAGGNYGVELTQEASDDTGSIIVGALLQDMTAATWSNFGPRVTVSAFGENLRTLFGPSGMFGDFGGTSGATPQVAATVAMMKEVNPLLTPAQAREILIATRIMGTANETVGGLVDIPAAVTKAKDVVATPAAARGFIEFRRKVSAILR